MKTVQIVTTKPDINTVEYAIYEDGELIRHGEVVNYTLGDLTTEQQAAIEAARVLLQSVAEADATDKGLL